MIAPVAVVLAGVVTVAPGLAPLAALSFGPDVATTATMATRRATMTNPPAPTRTRVFLAARRAASSRASRASRALMLACLLIGIRRLPSIGYRCRLWLA